MPEFALSLTPQEDRLRRLMLNRYYPFSPQDRGIMPRLPERPMQMGLQKPSDLSTLPALMKLLGKYGERVESKDPSGTAGELFDNLTLQRMDTAYQEKKRRELGLDVAPADKKRADAPTFWNPQKSSPYGNRYLPRLHQPTGQGESEAARNRKRDYWEDRIARITSGELIDPEDLSQGATIGAQRMIDTMLEDPSRYRKLMEFGADVVGKHEDKLRQFLAGEQFEIDLKKPPGIASN